MLRTKIINESNIWFIAGHLNEELQILEDTGNKIIDVVPQFGERESIVLIKYDATNEVKKAL